MCSKDFSSCIFDKGVDFHKKLPSDGGSIFISSTCYDLLDLRSELYRYLRSLGLHPRLSEFGYSDFAHPANHNAIETCLFNVDQADAYVLICHQRYGKEIDNIFWPISATHAEFCRALHHPDKPIFVYCREMSISERTYDDRPTKSMHCKNFSNQLLNRLISSSSCLTDTGRCCYACLTGHEQTGCPEKSTCEIKPYYDNSPKVDDRLKFCTFVDLIYGISAKTPSKRFIQRPFNSVRDLKGTPFS